MRLLKLSEYLEDIGWDDIGSDNYNKYSWNGIYMGYKYLTKCHNNVLTCELTLSLLNRYEMRYPGNMKEISNQL
jgi:hypothetical protein